MLDRKTCQVLRTLEKLSENNAYKVITVEDILATLPTKVYDTDIVKNTVEYLCKQEFIIIKFEEDNTFCYSLLPKARIYLETEADKKKVKKENSPAKWIILSAIISTLIATGINILFYYFLK